MAIVRAAAKDTWLCRENRSANKTSTGHWEREKEKERASLFPWGYNQKIFQNNRLPKLSLAYDKFTPLVRLIGLYSQAPPLVHPTIQ